MMNDLSYSLSSIVAAVQRRRMRKVRRRNDELLAWFRNRFEEILLRKQEIIQSHHKGACHLPFEYESDGFLGLALE